MIKAALFDFDGTLANTLPLCYYAFQEVFKKFDNQDLSPDEIISMFGPSETGIIRDNLKNKNKEEAIELYYQKYTEKHAEFVKENDDIIDMLQHLKEKGIKLGIITGKARRSFDISIEALKMDNLFEVIITGDDVIEAKPHPEGVMRALSVLEVTSKETIFIGDSEADIEAGERAYVSTAGVTWLPDYQIKEMTIKPNYMFEGTQEFKDFIDQLVQE